MNMSLSPDSRTGSIVIALKLPEDISTGAAATGRYVAQASKNTDGLFMYARIFICRNVIYVILNNANPRSLLP
jgi:hypothetical protein